jgi:hypothetical protein
MTRDTRLHWVRALLTGALAEVCTIITVLAVIFGHRVMSGGQSDQELQDFGLRAAALVGPLFGAIYTFLLALWVERKVEGRFLAHGLLVAAGAIALHLLGAFRAPGGFRALYVYADLLKLVAGAAAAFVAGRRPVTALSA